jgi:hypothetical protein
MLASHSHVGRNIKEIQNQKEELQLFQDTAKVSITTLISLKMKNLLDHRLINDTITFTFKSTFNYGYQLLNAAFVLRQSCKLNADTNMETIERLKNTWKSFDIVSEEQLTRLRVSAIFFKSVDEQTNKLEKLKESIEKLNGNDDAEKHESKLKKYLNTREQLLLEVGRMVRLGRLLKCRLKEPFLNCSYDE